MKKRSFTILMEIRTVTVKMAEGFLTEFVNE